MSRHHRFTVYDAMEAKGVFLANPANAGAVDKDGAGIYAGPVEYPKMFYHPDGAEKVLRKANVESTAFGPQMCNEHKAIIHTVARNRAEAEKLLAAGWHDHPAKAMAAAGKEAPPISSQQQIDSMNLEIERLKAQLANAQSAVSVLTPGAPQALEEKVVSNAKRANDAAKAAGSYLRP